MSDYDLVHTCHVRLLKKLKASGVEKFFFLLRGKLAVNASCMSVLCFLVGCKFRAGKALLARHLDYH